MDMNINQGENKLKGHDQKDHLAKKLQELAAAKKKAKEHRAHAKQQVDASIKLAEQEVKKIKKELHASERKKRTRDLIFLGGLVESRMNQDLAQSFMELLRTHATNAKNQESLAGIFDMITTKIPTQQDGSPWPVLWGKPTPQFDMPPPKHDFL